MASSQMASSSTSLSTVAPSQFVELQEDTPSPDLSLTMPLLSSLSPPPTTFEVTPISQVGSTVIPSLHSTPSLTILHSSPLHNAPISSSLHLTSPSPTLSHTHFMHSSRHPITSHSPPLSHTHSSPLSHLRTTFRTHDTNPDRDTDDDDDSDYTPDGDSTPSNIIIGAFGTSSLALVIKFHDPATLPLPTYLFSSAQLDLFGLQQIYSVSIPISVNISLCTNFLLGTHTCPPNIHHIVTLLGLPPVSTFNTRMTHYFSTVPDIDLTTPIVQFLS